MSMFLIAESSGPILDTRPVVLYTLDGVTTALVAFVLVGLVLPHIIKKPRQFYLVLGAVGVIIFFHMLTLMVQRPGFTFFAGIVTGAMQLAGIGLAVMATGGLGARDLGGEMLKSYEVLRRGETEKEVIIPIGGQQKKSEPERVVYSIDTPGSGPPGPAGKPQSPQQSQIPLDD